MFNLHPMRPLLRFLAIPAIIASPLAHAADAPFLTFDFDNGTNPPTGWITDYEWSGNTYYVENKFQITTGGGSVHLKPDAKYQSKSPMPGEGGAKMETIPFVFEPGYSYSCSLDVKGGPSRVYFAGYRWAPGVRPYDNPELKDLRMIYKSKAANTEASSGWTRVTLDFPGVTLSEQAIKHLKYVRFATLYVWFMKEGSIDNVVISKKPDPSLNF